ncbi:Aminopeptidase Y [Metarhizium acridum]|uniref:Aminopeptidase Y n=1 Tax=Metarhizium acridum TaxID=92637 RepID=UPI001C6B61AF|nr:Aminopeptidase Y [Metarhizium acridum]
MASAPRAQHNFYLFHLFSPLLLAIQAVNDRNMTRISYLVALSAAAAALQLPLQRPIKNNPHPSFHARPLVSSDTLQDSIDKDRLWERAEDLYALAKKSEDEFNHPTRVIGSPGHLGTLDYIKSELASLGGYYNVSEQEFDAYAGRVKEFRLVIHDTVPNTTTAFSLTPPTKDNEPVFGELILVGDTGCKASDYPRKVKGNIALIQRGKCAFGDKSQLAGRAGAAAAVIYNTVDEELHGTLGKPSPDHVATFGVSSKDAEEWVENLPRGQILKGSAYIDATVETIRTKNIIAQTTEGDANNCVMLGGHSDSVEEGPGINDDGSGSLSILEVASQLSAFRVENCVRFAWWSAEEEGLLGSEHYVKSLSDKENLNIRLFMDYDMMASPNFAYQIYNATDAENPLGSELLRDLYVDWYTKSELNYTMIEFDGRSDYDPFVRAGIPAGGIATGAEGVKTAVEVGLFGGEEGEWYDKNYHQIGDDLNNLNMTAWEVNTKLIAHSVATYAASFEGFPERTREIGVASFRKPKCNAYSPQFCRS